MRRRPDAAVKADYHELKLVRRKSLFPAPVAPMSRADQSTRATKCLIHTGSVHVQPPMGMSSLPRSRRSAASRELAMDVCPTMLPKMTAFERWEEQAALTAHLHASGTTSFVEQWKGRMRGDVLTFAASNGRVLMAD